MSLYVDVVIYYHLCCVTETGCRWKRWTSVEDVQL